MSSGVSIEPLSPAGAGRGGPCSWSMGRRRKCQKFPLCLPNQQRWDCLSGRDWAECAGRSSSVETQHRGCGEEWERCRPGWVPAVEPELAAGLCDQVQLCRGMNLALVPGCSPSWLAFCRYVAQRCAKSLSAAFSVLKSLSSCLLPCPELTGRRGRVLCGNHGFVLTGNVVAVTSSQMWAGVWWRAALLAALVGWWVSCGTTQEGPGPVGSAAQAPVHCQQCGCGSQLLVPLWCAPPGLVSILNCSFDSGGWGSAVLVPYCPVVVDCCTLKTSMGLGRNLSTSKQRSHLLILLCLGGAGICNFNYFGFLLKQRAHFGSAASLPSLAWCHCFSAWWSTPLPLQIK